jgi:lysyl-tRNA synthetase class 1
MFATPRRAKRLHFDVIPRHVDDYLSHVEKFPELSPAEHLENPVWHVHGAQPPAPETGIGYAVLLNLASVCNTEDVSVLWGFISRYAPGAAPETAPILDELVALAINYYRDFVKPEKRYRRPDAIEAKALEELVSVLEAMPIDADASAIQSEVYEIGKRHEFENLRAWFKALYEILLGQEQGPRMGSFIALYGISETVALIRRVLAGEDLGA